MGYRLFFPAIFIYGLSQNICIRCCVHAFRWNHLCVRRTDKQINDGEFSFWVCRETHFWYVLPDEVKSESLLSQYSELLSPREKENLDHMQGDQFKKSALLARVLVRTTIARCRFVSKSWYLLINLSDSVFCHALDEHRDQS